MHLQAVAHLAWGHCSCCGQPGEHTLLGLLAGDCLQAQALFCRRCIGQGTGLETEVKERQVGFQVKDVRWLSRKGEKQTARETGGRLTKASGATCQDGDIHAGKWMIEEKCCQAERFGLTSALVKKTVLQGIRSKKEWVIKLRLLKENLELAVLDWRVFWSLTDDDDSAHEA